MALRVFNQISSIKLPKPGSIRSVSADRSTRNRPDLIEPLKQLKEEPCRHRLFSPRRRSLSLPTKCEFRNYATIFEEAHNKDEELEVFKNNLPSVLERSQLPINYEQFSTKRGDEIKNITQLAKEFYQKFQLKPRRAGYVLNDSRKKGFPFKEDEAFKRRHMHNDYISGSHLQPKNLSPFDEIHITDEPVVNICTNPQISYYYVNSTKGKFLERGKKATQQRNYATYCNEERDMILIPRRRNEIKEENNKTGNMIRKLSTKVQPSSKEEEKANIENALTVIEVKNFKKSKVVPFKSYSDHLKETPSKSIPFNQKRMYSMIPRSKTYKLDSKGSPNPIHQGKIIFECKASAATEMNKEAKGVKKFLPSSTQKLYLSRNINNKKNNFVYNPKIDPYSVIDEKRNVRHKYILKEKINIPEPNFNTKQKRDNSIEEVSYVNTNLYPKIDDIRASLNKTLPIDKLMDRFNNASILEPTSINTIITPTARKISSIRHCGGCRKPYIQQQTRNFAKSATYTAYDKLFLSPSPSPEKLYDNPGGKYLSKPSKLKLPLTTIIRNYSTPSDPCKNNKDEKKVPVFPNSKIPKEVLEKHKVDLFDGICDPPTKTYEPNKPCICVEPYLPSKLPKLKRLQKRLTLDDPIGIPDECRESCQPRADENLKEKKKQLPPLPCSDCPCVEPPPLDACNPLPRLTKRFVVMDKHKVCIPDPCPPRADEKLVEKKKCLKPLRPSDCKCVEPYLPTKLPQMKRLEKKVNVDEAPVAKECFPPPCPPRADDGKNLYGKKLLPKIECNNCPCVEPYPLDECAPLPRLKKRPVFQDAVCPQEEICPLKSDDVCGYEEPKRKLKPLLPCVRSGLKTSVVCESKKDAECKETNLPACPPDPCNKTPPPKQEGLINGLLQKLINYFKARPDCPPPDEWKKRYLREKAEKAAKAAGLELCEPKGKVGLDLCGPKSKSLKDVCDGSVRHYSSSSGAWDKNTNVFINENKLANEMELKQLIYRILKLLRVDDKDNTSETCDQLLKEFMDLSEDEFQYIKTIIGDAHESLLCSNAGSLVSKRKSEAELEQKMVETLDLFCKKASYLRNITYLEYEELEKMKTRAMQNKLDQMLKKYKVEEEG